MAKDYLPLALFDDAARAVSNMAEVTNRTEEEVVADALNTYHFLLEQQARGRKIMCVNGREGRQDEELENFVAIDAHVAKKILKVWDRP